MQHNLRKIPIAEMAMQLMAKFNGLSKGGVWTRLGKVARGGGTEEIF